MAFLNLRPNNTLYILKKDQLPVLEIGKVTNISLPVPKYNNNMYNQEMIIDITADINGNSINFLKISANSDIADFGNNVVIACNKDVMNSEIYSLKLKSQDIINSISLHENIIKNCDLILELLNPEIIEKLRLEKENLALREELNALKEMFKEFMNSKSYGNNN